MREETELNNSAEVWIRGSASPLNDGKQQLQFLTFVLS